MVTLSLAHSSVYLEFAPTTKLLQTGARLLGDSGELRGDICVSRLARKQEISAKRTLRCSQVGGVPIKPQAIL